MKETKSTAEIQIFCYKSLPVRTTEIDGEIWFVAKDVADILGFEDATHAIRGLDDDEKGLQKVETPGGVQDMTVISEPGLYTMLMRSNKPEAKPFRRWVTHDVLPSIRKTGSYSVPRSCAKPEKKSRVSIGWVKAVERIIDRAYSAKTDEDFERVLALDLAFQRKEGYSALNSAGLSIEFDGRGNWYRDWNRISIDWEYHYKLVRSSKLTLPTSWTEEHWEENEHWDEE